LKIEKKFSLSKLATTPKKKFEIFIFYFYFYFLFFIFFRVCADALVSAWTHPSVRADAVFTALADGKNPSAGKTASAG
jgi:hypothetical protein